MPTLPRLPTESPFQWPPRSSPPPATAGQVVIRRSLDDILRAPGKTVFAAAHLNQPGLRIEKEFLLTTSSAYCFYKEHVESALHVFMYGSAAELRLDPDKGELLIRYKAEGKSCQASCLWAEDGKVTRIRLMDKTHDTRLCTVRHPEAWPAGLKDDGTPFSLPGKFADRQPPDIPSGWINNELEGMNAQQRDMLLALLRGADLVFEPVPGQSAFACMLSEEPRLTAELHHDGKSVSRIRILDEDGAPELEIVHPSVRGSADFLARRQRQIEGVEQLASSSTATQGGQESRATGTEGGEPPAAQPELSARQQEKRPADAVAPAAETTQTAAAASVAQTARTNPRTSAVAGFQLTENELKQVKTNLLRLNYTFNGPDAAFQLSKEEFLNIGSLAKSEATFNALGAHGNALIDPNGEFRLAREDVIEIAEWGGKGNALNALVKHWETLTDPHGEIRLSPQDAIEIAKKPSGGTTLNALAKSWKKFTDPQGQIGMPREAVIAQALKDAPCDFTALLKETMFWSNGRLVARTPAGRS